MAAIAKFGAVALDRTRRYGGAVPRLVDQSFVVIVGVARIFDVLPERVPPFAGAKIVERAPLNRCQRVRANVKAFSEQVALNWQFRKFVPDAFKRALHYGFRVHVCHPLPWGDILAPQLHSENPKL